MKISHTTNKVIAVISILFASHALAAPKYLSEGERLFINNYNDNQSATYSISKPGVSSWLENAKYHSSDNMPACLVMYTERLNEAQIKQFIDDIDISTRNDRKLTVESYKGTLVFVDRDTGYIGHTDTSYTIKTKDNLTFGQLLYSVGGYENSHVEISFSRGCKALALPPYYPS